MGLMKTIVGSFPKPAALRRARWRHEEGEIEVDELQQLERQTTAKFVAWQEQLGFDSLIDGEFDRGDLVSHFGERLEGFERGGLVRVYGNRYYRRPRIIDEVKRGEALVVEPWKAAQALTRRPLRAVITGPYTLMDWSFDEYYSDRQACCMAMAAALREEVEALLAAGAQEIQIDDPAIGSRVDELEMARQALEQVTAPLQGKARSWARLCYGDPVERLGGLPQLPVDGLMLEMTNADFAPLDAIDSIDDSGRLGIGVVDATTSQVESVQTIRQRIERVLQRLPAERIVFHPDAGLGGLPEDAARQKLEHLAQAADSIDA